MCFNNPKNIRFICEINLSNINLLHTWSKYIKRKADAKTNLSSKTVASMGGYAVEHASEPDAYITITVMFMQIGELLIHCLQKDIAPLL